MSNLISGSGKSPCHQWAHLRNHERLVLPPPEKAVCEIHPRCFCRRSVDGRKRLFARHQHGASGSETTFREL